MSLAVRAGGVHDRRDVAPLEELLLPEGPRLHGRDRLDDLGHGAAVAAVGQHQHPHALLELRKQGVDLVVDELAVVEAPRLVLAVALVAVTVRQLAAVPGVMDQEDVARPQPARGVTEGLFHGRTGRLLRQEQAIAAVELEVLLLGNRD